MDENLLKKLVLIDGNALFYKAFYASFYSAGGNKLENRDVFYDKKNNGVRAFANMIINIKTMSDNIVVAFDHKNTSTYRHQYDFYKAGRNKTPIDLYRQMDLSKEFLNLIGITWYEDKEHEADDIIGIIAKQNSDIYNVDIITTDKDLLQLVDKNINVKISKIGVSNIDIFNVENFSNKFLGLIPDQVRDLKGIMGDASDNLKGIYGIGEKGAVALLEKYQTLESVLENHLGNETEVMSRKIEEGKDSGILCKKLATIKIEGNLNLNVEMESVCKPINDSELKNWLTNNELNNLKNKI